MTVLKQKDFEFKVWDDEHGYNQLEDHFQEVMFISNNRDYSNKNTDLKIEGFLPSLLRRGEIPNLQKTKKINGKIYQITPVFSYIHSGIALSLNNDGYPFNDRWDAGFFGVLLHKKGDIVLDSFISSWASLLNGEVYGFTLEMNGKQIESVGGYFGYDSEKEMIESMLESVCEGGLDKKLLLEGV
jgi:hypothetical protein